jgi:RNA 2',3'-cyclic 3'-phosphodiesterase
MTGPSRLRLFVAIELPGAWKMALADLQQRMDLAMERDPNLGAVRLRWVRPEVIHLTLKFLGEVEADRLAAIREHLERAVALPRGLSLGLAGAGAFSDREAPRVLWVSVDDGPSHGLASLAERIDVGLEGAGFPRERRPFRPHLTLCRLPDQLSPGQRRRCVEVATAVSLPAVDGFEVDSVSLMQSFLGAGGARYERLDRWPQ